LPSVAETGSILLIYEYLFDMIKDIYRRDYVKKTVKIYRMGEEPKERKYWLTRPAVERFQALEQMRQSFYDNSSEGFQRVYRIVKQK
jgi:hypothetical protein